MEQTICCNTGAGGYCSTDTAEIAYCITEVQPETTPPPAQGYYTYWTVTTYETDTVMTTYTYSSWIGITTQVQVQTCPMDWAGMTTVCGGMCCSTNQYCNLGTCTTNGAAYTVTGAGATAGTRGTSVTGAIITSTISPTVTTGFGTPVPASSGNVTLVSGTTGSSGLSGGAIAGIVLGVIFGLLLLLLICLCLCLRAGAEAILSFFGLGRRRRRRGRVIEEERIERRRRGTVDGRRWYGETDRPSRTSVTRIEERRTSGAGGFGGLAAGLGLGGLAAALGFRRAEEGRRRRDDKTDTEVSYDSYYYDSDYYSGEPRETIRLVKAHDSDD